MLAYMLGLPAESLQAGNDHDEPVVIVDDCVISGLRLRQTIDRLDGRIAVATLFSHPDLRDAVGTQEEHVELFCSAEDLVDLAPDIYGPDYAAWRDLWIQRRGSAVFWVGEPEYVCFAWNEPDTVFLNSITDTVEPGFRLLSHERCLKHRANRDRGGDVDRIPEAIQLCVSGPGPLTIPDHVVTARVDDRQLAIADFGEGVAESRQGECYLLDETAADMWSALVETGNAEAALVLLSRRYAVDRDVIEGDLTRFLDQLLEAGLLQRA
jgi:hypothetical protein